MTGLILFRLSTAFSIPDYTLLLKQLECSFGTMEIALTWVKLYVSERPGCVSIAEWTSLNVHCHFGVPNGPVLGSEHYCMYTKSVGEIIKRYIIKFHCYGDGAQVLKTLKIKATKYLG